MRDESEARTARRTARLALGAIQRRQHGAFTRQQAISAGVSAKAVDGRVRHGRYRVLLPGVMAEQGVPDSWELRAMSAILWAGGEALLARGTAAKALGLPVPAEATRRIHLLVRNRTFVTPSGIVVHRTRSLPATDRTSVGPLWATTATRTVCDLAGHLGSTDLRQLVSAAVRNGSTDAVAMRTALRRLGRIRGAVQLRHLVDELSPLDAQCDSALETVYLRMARRYGIEPTAMNHPVRDGSGRRRYLDAVYLPEHVWVELDSERFHGTLLDRNDDTLRTISIERVGEWADPLRFTWQDVTQRPAVVADQVRAALADARTVG